MSITATVPAGQAPYVLGYQITDGAYTSPKRYVTVSSDMPFFTNDIVSIPEPTSEGKARTWDVYNLRLECTGVLIGRTCIGGMVTNVYPPSAGPGSPWRPEAKYSVWTDSKVSSPLEGYGRVITITGGADGTFVVTVDGRQLTSGQMSAIETVRDQYDASLTALKLDQEPTDAAAELKQLAPLQAQVDAEEDALLRVQTAVLQQATGQPSCSKRRPRTWAEEVAAMYHS